MENKPPSFQFYAQDFLTGTMYLTNEEIGIYIKMLAKQWTDNKIPKKRLGFLVGINWDKFSEELKAKFIDEGDYLINERLEKEREKKNKFIEKQRENGSKGGRPKKNNNPNKTQTITQIKPLEEEDEIEEEIEIRKLKIKFGENENVKLKIEEKEKLIDKLGERGFNFCIQKLSNYKLSSGKKYKSDYGAINSWVIKEWEKEQEKKPFRLQMDDLKIDNSLTLEK